ncbi:hypothetical protein [Planctomicrobium piriforme]|uniref:Peptidase MA superfamily protein n=1 Tax=Planctomicrobium piriforme TaxID=1576369 RepID=A0A1I3NA35_9PLAN|nr:hypothetical protein [Planctomicrobium piriforme]SFJ06005.1 hypothetical protein SAMN05421753_11539 [Planctomicrobium piriforme]
MPSRFQGACALYVAVALVLGAFAGGNSALAATHTTTNFVVTAPSDDIARRVANCAEYWRRELALQWLEEPLPNWFRPCPISVKVGQIGAGGQTTFTFENGEVFGWKMQVQGTLERILDSVIPHEVNHTIFASYFRRPLPRWADEGAATLFEHESEQARQNHLLNQVFNTSRKIPLKNLLAIREYPEDMQDVLTLYAEGYSLAGFLVGSKGEQGRKTYLKFLDDAHKIGWDKSIARHYGYNSVDELEQRWSSWIVAGSPAPVHNPGEKLAQQSQPAGEKLMASNAQPEYVIRSQSPSDTPAVTAANRTTDSMQSIPRSLRTARAANAGADSDAPLRTAELSRPGVRTASHEVAEADGENTKPVRPRPPATLSPTAQGIDTNLNAEHYSFPDARR